MATIRRIILPLITVVVASSVFFAAQPLLSQQNETIDRHIPEEAREHNMQVATLGAGCFWSIEALYEKLEGVSVVESGYAGGWKEQPTSEELLGGTTGHAEVVQITYHPDMVSYNELLEVFWQVHDPTTLNRQGDDVGTLYRSLILYHDEDQKRWAEESMRNAAKEFNDPIVTEIVPMEAFYPAEEYHQDFYENNSNSRYCRTVITPKLRKMKRLGVYD